MMDEISSSTYALQNGFRVYKYRWVVLGIFCLFTITNFMQLFQFSIISNIIIKYYDVSSFAVDCTGLIFFFIYIVFFLPVSFLIEKYNLKVTALVGMGLTLTGNLVKLLCAQPDRFFVVIIGQCLCAIGQVYMLSIPSKFASVWFGADEVSTATALAVLGTQLGVAIGCVLPPQLVQSGSQYDVGEDLFDMLIYNSVFSGVVFVIVAIFFKAKPATPPSQSQMVLMENENTVPFFTLIKKLSCNKNFQLLVVAVGLNNGIWNSFGILINQIYVDYFPGHEQDAGIIALLAIISGGCVGSLIFGYILDKTHQFKATTITALLMSAVTFTFVIIVFERHSVIGSYITIPIFGFFTASTLVIAFEFGIEITYPIPETLSCSIINGIVFCYAIIVSLLLDALFPAIGYFYSNIVILVTLFLCAFIMFFITPNLSRREANLNMESTPVNVP